jgi:hypothetical protein
MATMEELVRAEHSLRSLLEENDLPQPDSVEYGYGTVWVRWNDRRLVVAIDVDEPPPEECSGPDPAEG